MRVHGSKLPEAAWISTYAFHTFPAATVTSAIAFHVETFGPDVFNDEETVLEAYIAETGVTI